MNNLEQRIWDYLDGICNEQERKEIEHLIESDLESKAIYMELKSINQDFSKLDLDEPSMSFTRNVMEKVNLGAMPGTFKSLTDNRIIYGIAAFFLISIFSLLSLLIYHLNWSQPVAGILHQYKMPEINLSGYLNNTIVNLFFFADMILALYLLDNFLRKPGHLKGIKI